MRRHSCAQRGTRCEPTTRRAVLSVHSLADTPASPHTRPQASRTTRDSLTIAVLYTHVCILPRNPEACRSIHSPLLTHVHPHTPEYRLSYLHWCSLTGAGLQQPWAPPCAHTRCTHTSSHLHRLLSTCVRPTEPAAAPSDCHSQLPLAQARPAPHPRAAVCLCTVTR